MRREIPKKVPAPPLTDKVIEALTLLCFGTESPQIPPVDCLFLFGTSIGIRTLADTARALLSEVPIKTLLITGGVKSNPDKELKESEYIYKKLAGDIPSSCSIHLETRSRNTCENVLFGFQELKEAPQTIAFISKSFHAGRAQLTLRRFTQVPLYQRTYAPHYPTMKEAITAENWMKYNEGRARVWAEYLRIKTYGARNDLNLNESKALIELIALHE